MTIMTLILSCCIGLGLGSVTHFATYRFTPNKTTCSYLYDITLRCRYCPICQSKLPLWQIIPLLSWLITKGRCYLCQQKVMFDDLTIELIITLVVIIITARYGFDGKSLILMILAGYFLMLAVIDFRYYLLPDSFTLPLLWSGLLLAYYDLSDLSLDHAVFGCMIGYLLLWIPASIYYLCKKKHGLGGGDIKLLAALGAWIDYCQLPLLLSISAALGISYCLIMRWLLNQPVAMIAFGPYLLTTGYLVKII